jgi:hypothetical protein
VPDFRPQQDLNPFVSKQLLERRSDIRILPPGKLRSPLDHRHRGAKPPHRLRQLETDVAAAEYDQVLRHPFELEQFDMRHRRCVAQPGYVRYCGAGAEIQKYSFPDNGPCGSVAVMNGDGLRTHEAGRPHNQFDACGFVSANMDLNEIRHHPAFAFLNGFHVRAKGTRVDPELRST